MRQLKYILNANQIFIILTNCCFKILDVDNDIRVLFFLSSCLFQVHTEISAKTKYHVWDLLQGRFEKEKCRGGWSRLAVICGLLGLCSEYTGINYNVLSTFVYGIFYNKTFLNAFLIQNISKQKNELAVLVHKGNRNKTRLGKTRC